MAGYDRLYCVGEPGGFMGADGINPIYFQILVGNSDRMWLEPRYFVPFRPIGGINVVIPESPDSQDALIDACVAFAPRLFRNAPSMKDARRLLARFTRLDFDMGRDKIPDIWEKLREEARPDFEKLHIYRGLLEKVDLLMHPSVYDRHGKSG